MPNDAKLGLVFGVGLVVAVAVVFFRKEPSDDAPAPAAVSPSGGATLTTAPPARQAPGQMTSGGPRRQGSSRRYVVQEGDTLYNLARRYYKNDAKFVDIYQANRHTLSSPDPLPPGTVLVLPDLPDEEPAGQDP